MATPTIYLHGMREVDDEFEKMIAARDACWAANVPLPGEVREFFGGDPDEADYELKLRKYSVKILGVDAGGGDVFDRDTDSTLIESGIAADEDVEDAYIYDIHLDRLPTALKTLRLEIRW